MLASCPSCAFQGEIEAFFAEGEGKRLAAIMAELPPECGRSMMAYLRLFKPPKTGLRPARWIKLSSQVLALVQAGSVCRDERSGVRRAATPQLWAEGMEIMLAQRDSLTLPLETHGYLRAVVFGLADKADAAIERKREMDARAGNHLAQPSGKSDAVVGESPLQRQLKWIEQMEGVGGFTSEEAEAERQKAHAKYGGGNG